MNIAYLPHDPSTTNLNLGEPFLVRYRNDRIYLTKVSELSQDLQPWEKLRESVLRVAPDGRLPLHVGVGVLIPGVGVRRFMLALSFHAGHSAQFERMVNNQICSIELVDDTKYVLRCKNTPDAVSHTDIILATEA